MDLTMLHERLATLRERIVAAELRFQRTPGSTRMIAVSKTQPAPVVMAAARLGLTAFGENYAQEALAKISACAALGLEWHFIGPLQSNKTRPVAEHFAWVHSVDRLKIAQRLNDQRPVRMSALEVCVEVNVSAESSKSGVAPAELPALLDAVHALPRLRLRGLMTLPAPSADFEVQRRQFRTLAELLHAANARGHALDTLSMGTTADLEAAIAEGATLVRVGTALFGARAARAGQA
jgi:hypothetical protein